MSDMIISVERALDESRNGGYWDLKEVNEQYKA